MDPRHIRAASAPLRAVVRAVPSKSVTHRALVAAALASGTSILENPLDADDTRRTVAGLVQLGFQVDTLDGAWRVAGGGGRVPGGGEIALGESGTSARFLLALAAIGERPARLAGSQRLAERPLGELAGALRRLGAHVNRLKPDAELPLEAGGGLVRGDALTIDGSRTSQFTSALLLVGPALPRGLDLTLGAAAVSLPYVFLTVAVMEAFGARVERLDARRFRVAPGGYASTTYSIEGDHSSASYFLAAAAIAGGTVRVEALRSDSAQPDARFTRILADLGCRVASGADWIEVEGSGRLPGFECDLHDSPDIAPTIAVLALFAEGPCTLRGLAHLRFKESDRLDLLARNLRALGRDASAHDDRLEIGPPGSRAAGEALIATGSDHRMAMAFAVAGLRVPRVVIDDSACVAKSYPRFWEDFARLEPSSGL